jgi:4-amino-4-deoxy-L-arabinose transferase-like glycosyltransferase
MLLSFVFSTLVCTLDVRKWNLRDGIAPILLVAVLLVSVTPFALPLSMLLCAIAAGYLVYAAIQALLREDISWVGASLVGLVGMACAAVLFLGMPSEIGYQGWVLGIILLVLAMLPFFTTAAAIRDLRTT